MTPLPRAEPGSGGLVRSLLAPNPSPMTLEGTRTYLVGRVRPVVIDPGPAERRHLDAITAALGGARPLALLLTHGHEDHAAGAAALAARTGAPVWMAAGALDPAVPAARVDRWAGADDALDTDAGAVSPVPTPGHAPEHLCFLLRPRPAAAAPAALFVGDLLLGWGDTTLVAEPEGDLAAYLASLDRVERLGAAVLYPAHGPTIHDVAGALARYRSHRAGRVEQVAAALRDGGGATAAALVDRVYGPTLDPRLRPAAEASLRAILAYLRRTGRIDLQDGAGYTLTV